jgi:hypothetical protein
MEHLVCHKYTEDTEGYLVINLLNSLAEFYASFSILNNLQYCLANPSRCVKYDINYTYFVENNTGLFDDDDDDDDDDYYYYYYYGAFWIKINLLCVQLYKCTVFKTSSRLTTYFTLRWW